MKKIFFTTLTALTPVMALAQGEFAELDSFIGNIIDFINNTIVPLVFVIAFVVFIWGVYQYFIAGASDPEAQGKGKDLVKYALIGFILMISVWGIVNLIAGGLGLADPLEGDLIPTAPTR